MASTTAERPPSPSPSQLPPVPRSPTCSYASTVHPAFSLPPPPPPPPPQAVLTKQDLGRSQEAYADLISSAKIYRQALAALSTAASSFGSALESCARLKEARAEKTGTIPAGAGMATSFVPSSDPVTADTLLAAAGLHHLISNHQKIVSETVYRSFEVPLLHDLDKWRHATTSENESYTQAVKNASKEITKLEKEGVKLQKAKRRDVGKFRAHLVELTGKLDGLTQLNVSHAMTLLRDSQDTSTKITEAACSLVRAEMDIFESLARKGWSGGGLEDLLEKGTDLFAPEDIVCSGMGHMVGSTGDGLFSILPPKSILAETSASSPERNGTMALHRPLGHGRTGSVLSDPTMFAHQNRGSNDNDSIFSETRSRHLMRRPFSPQPIRRVPTDVTYDNSLGVGLGPSGLGGSAANPRTQPIREESSELVVDHEDAMEDGPLLPVLDDAEVGADGEEKEDVPDKRPYSLGYGEYEQPWRDEGVTGTGAGQDSPAAGSSQSDGKQSSMERWTTVKHADGD